MHVDETLRMSALSLLCTDLRMTTVPPAAEMDLLREVRAAQRFQHHPMASPLYLVSNLWCCGPVSVVALVLV